MNTIDGILLAILEDYGPDPLVNLTEFDLGTATSLSIAGMTIVALGSSDRVYQRLFGSIPVPGNADWEAMPFIFNVFGGESTDARIKVQGRECVLFLLFKAENRSHAYSIHSDAEQLLIQQTQKFNTRDDMTQEVITSILEQLQQISPPAPQEVSTPVESPIITEKSGLEFFTLSPEGDPQSTSLTEGLKAPLMLLVNHVNQTILRLTLSESVSERKAYLAGSAATKMNVERYQNAYRIRDVDDPLEIHMVLEKIKSSFDLPSDT